MGWHPTATEYVLGCCGCVWFTHSHLRIHTLCNKLYIKMSVFVILNRALSQVRAASTNGVGPQPLLTCCVHTPNS